MFFIYPSLIYSQSKLLDEGPLKDTFFIFMTLRVKIWHFDGQRAKPCISIVVFENFCSYNIFSKKNKQTLYFEIHIEYSAN